MEDYPSNTDPEFDITEETPEPLDKSQKKRISETKAELLSKVALLEQKLEQKEEILFDAGLAKRETMMSAIEDYEKDTITALKYIIRECEKVTGRPLDICPLCYSEDFI